MKLIKQSFEIMVIPMGIMQTIERAGRTCYKSEDKITKNSSYKFAEMLIKRDHMAMIEFGDIIVKFITNRGVTHELVRHRHCSFAQESTRYVRYEGDMEFIEPVWWGDMYNNFKDLFLHTLTVCEDTYKRMIFNGYSPQQAREVLPNALKTEIVVKANVREWRHIFKLRCAKSAHPQIRELMLGCLAEFKLLVPVLFDDLKFEDNSNEKL